MITRTVRLGEREVTRMGLGTNRLTATPERIELIRAAAHAGIGLIDTAHLYSGGDSEPTIGAALAGSEAPVVVATKGGFRPGEGNPEILRAQVQESLRRLRVERIDLYYLHRVDPQTPLEVSLGVLAEYRQRGQIAEVGLSHVSVDEIERGRAVVPIAAVQNEHNLARRSDEVIDYCEREGIVFVPYFPLHGDAGRAVSQIAQRHGATPAQVTLAWLLHRSPVVLPIPGSLSIEHVRQNVAALDIELSPEELVALG